VGPYRAGSVPVRSVGKKAVFGLCAGMVSQRWPVPDRSQPRGTAEQSGLDVCAGPVLHPAGLCGREPHTDTAFKNCQIILAQIPVCAGGLGLARPSVFVLNRAFACLLLRAQAATVAGLFGAE